MLAFNSKCHSTQSVHTTTTTFWPRFSTCWKSFGDCQQKSRCEANQHSLLWTPNVMCELFRSKSSSRAEQLCGWRGARNKLQRDRGVQEQPRVFLANILALEAYACSHTAADRNCVDCVSSPIQICLTFCFCFFLIAAHYCSKLLHQPQFCLRLSINSLPC